MTNKGQSLVEMVFLMGATALILTGAITLLISSISSRTKSFDRKKAAELSSVVMENLISQKENNPDVFWNLTPINVPKENPNFPDFTYTIGYVNTTGTDCPVSSKCAEAEVDIIWNKGTAETLKFYRLFTR